MRAARSDSSDILLRQPEVTQGKTRVIALSPASARPPGQNSDVMLATSRSMLYQLSQRAVADGAEWRVRVRHSRLS